MPNDIVCACFERGHVYRSFVHSDCNCDDLNSPEHGREDPIDSPKSRALSSISRTLQIVMKSDLHSAPTKLHLRVTQHSLLFPETEFFHHTMLLGAEFVEPPQCVNVGL